MLIFSATREEKNITPPEQLKRIEEGARARRQTLRFPLWPKQKRAFNSIATEQLYGGAAGGGKSHWMRVCLIMWAFMIPGLQCYLFRRLYADLRKNHMEGPKSFPMLLGESVNAGLATITSHEITLYNGSKIFLNHLQHSKDLTKYHGPEMHVIAFDELTHFEEAQYRFLRSRLRMVGIHTVPPHLQGRFPRIIAGSNPGSVGHAWVKKMFIGKKMGELEPFTIYEQPKREGGMLRQFIPARLEDNPSLMEDDPDYEDKLAGLGDPVLIRAYREGDWDIVVGSMFGENWRDTTIDHETLPDGKPWHVCDPFPIHAGWPLWRSADDGVTAPFAGYWHTRDPHTDTHYVIAELYRRGMMPEDVAEAVKEQDLLIEIVDGRGHVTMNRNFLEGKLDNSAFSNTGASAVTRGEQMNNLGCNWEPVEKWPGSRVARVQNLHRMMKPNPKEKNLKPGIVFFSTCVKAIEIIPTIMRNEKPPHEDVSDDSSLHAFDGVTYGTDYERTTAKRIKLGGV